MARRALLGLDIGATKTHAVALDSDGNGTLVDLTRPTGHGELGLARSITSIVSDVGARLGDVPIVSVGIGIPGIVDRESGVVSRAVNLGIDEFDVAGAVSSAVPVPVVVDNDVNVAALGAAHVLSDEGSLAFLNLGTGIAAGMVVGARPWPGAYGTAGEIGHHPLIGNTLSCPCGQIGCLETVASGTGLARAWPRAAGSPSADLVQCALRGDPEAEAVLRRFVGGVASAVQMIALTWDPRVIAIGGGLTAMAWPLESGLRAVFAERARKSGFVAGLELDERVRFIDTRIPIAPIGAALLVPETV